MILIFSGVISIRSASCWFYCGRCYGQKFCMITLPLFSTFRFVENSRVPQHENRYSPWRAVGLRVMFQPTRTLKSAGCPHWEHFKYQCDTVEDLLQFRPKEMMEFWGIGPVRARDIAAWRRHNGLNFTLIEGTPEKEAWRSEERVRAAKRKSAADLILRDECIVGMRQSGRSWDYIATWFNITCKEVRLVCAQ